MTDTISIQRDGTVWYGVDSGRPGKWAWHRIGRVKRVGPRKWAAVSPDARGQHDYVAQNCPTRHEAVMALRWPDDVPEAYR